MKKNIILLLFLFIQAIVSAQEKMSCIEYNFKSVKAYREENYQLSLDYFQKGIENNCESQFDANDFYNAACSAALNKNKKLTFVYLNKAVDKGWDDIAHMTKDTDIDFVRNDKEYQKVIKKINEKDVELYSILKNIKPADFNDAIPYTSGGKWGWLHRKTLRPLTKTVFDYTDFATEKGIYFIYEGKKKYYSGIIQAVQSEVYPAPELDEDFQETKIASDPQDGFILTDGVIRNFAKKYKNVSLINNFSSTKIAIATNQVERKGIIYEDGKVFGNFDFNYSNIDYFNTEYGSTYFVAQKYGESLSWIYDESAKVVYNEPISRKIDFNYFQRTPSEESVYIGTKSYKKYVGIYLKDNKFNVLTKDGFNPIFKSNYDEFIFVNGLKKTESINNDDNGAISEIFFFVKKEDKTFYVDEEGKEYQVKKK